MKVNEAPEKIILSADRDTQIIYDKWVTKDYTDNIKIEYTRTDVFIEKLENYLKNQFIKDVSVLAGGAVNISFNTAISNLINYMKGE